MEKKTTKQKKIYENVWYWRAARYVCGAFSILFIFSSVDLFIFFFLTIRPLFRSYKVLRLFWYVWCGVCVRCLFAQNVEQQRTKNRIFTCIWECFWPNGRRIVSRVISDILMMSKAHKTWTNTFTFSYSVLFPFPYFLFVLCLRIRANVVRCVFLNFIKFFFSQFYTRYFYDVSALRCVRAVFLPCRFAYHLFLWFFFVFKYCDRGGFEEQPLLVCTIDNFRIIKTKLIKTLKKSKTCEKNIGRKNQKQQQKNNIKSTWKKKRYKSVIFSMFSFVFAHFFSSFYRSPPPLSPSPFESIQQFLRRWSHFINVLSASQFVR